MSGQLAPCAASTRLLSRTLRRSVRLAPALQRCECVKRVVGARRQEVRQPETSRPGHVSAAVPRVLAGCSAAAVSLFVPLLPSWASEVLDDAYIDPSLAESPDILGTLLIVVSTYFIVMMMYLWLSSWLDEDVNNSSTDKQQPPDQQDLPPGYSSFLNAHVRSYVDPHGNPGDGHVRALAALDDVTEPLEGEDLEQLKHRLAAGAAEALDQQLRDVERLVRTKLLARKLGYTNSSAKLDTAVGKTSSKASSSSSSADHVDVAPSEIASLLVSAVLNTPNGLNSFQHKAALDALIDKEIEKQLPAGGGAWHDDLVIRGVMRRLVSALVMEESLLLLEGVDHGRKALEASGKLSKQGSKKWALW